MRIEFAPHLLTSNGGNAPYKLLYWLIRFGY